MGNINSIPRSELKSLHNIESWYEHRVKTTIAVEPIRSQTKQPSFCMRLWLYTIYLCTFELYVLISVHSKPSIWNTTMKFVYPVALTAA